MPKTRGEVKKVFFSQDHKTRKGYSIQEMRRQTKADKTTQEPRQVNRTQHNNIIILDNIKKRQDNNNSQDKTRQEAKTKQDKTTTRQDKTTMTTK
jgi:hypothetical protein